MFPEISIFIILSLSFGKSHIIDSSQKLSATSPSFVKQTFPVLNSSVDKTKDLSEFPNNVPSGTQAQIRDSISLNPWSLGHSEKVTEQFVPKFPRIVTDPSPNDIKLSTVLKKSDKNKNYAGKFDLSLNNNISFGVNDSTINSLKSSQKGGMNSQQQLTDLLMDTGNNQSSFKVQTLVYPEFQLPRMFQSPQQKKTLLTRKQRNANPSTTSSSFLFSKLRFKTPYFLNPVQKTDYLSYIPNHERDIPPNFKSMMLSSPVTFFHPKRASEAPERAGHRQSPVPSELIVKRTKAIPVYQIARGIRNRRRYDVPQIECPPTADGTERFSCPSPDHMGRYKCILDHAMCDGFIDCPNEEDEDRMSCMFFQTTKAHLDVLADALLRWARGRY